MAFQRQWIVAISRTITIDAAIMCRVYPEYRFSSEPPEPAHADIEEIRLGAGADLLLDPDELDRYERMEIEASAVRAVLVATVTATQDASAARAEATTNPGLHEAAQTTRHQEG